MKSFLPIIIIACVFCSCGQSSQKASKGELPLLKDKVRFCESVVFDGDRLLVANFGTEQMEPLNSEGKGYILSFDDTVSQVLIPASGVLSAPKGMLVHGRFLFIADVGKLVVYDLDSLGASPHVVPFNEQEVFLNDMAIDQRTSRMYITVTNTGNIYSLDISKPMSMTGEDLVLYDNIPGANGIAIHNNTMYVASYPADGVTTDDNVIYVIEDMTSVEPTLLIARPGQYDGLVVNDSGDKLYFTNWQGGELGVVDLASREVEILETSPALVGGARMQLKDGILYIPDLVQSFVMRRRLE